MLIFLKKLEVQVNDLLYMFVVMPYFLGIWMYCWSCWEFSVYLLAELIFQMLGYMYKSLEYYSMFTWNVFLDWKWSKREYIGIEFGLILCLCCKLYLKQRGVAKLKTGRNVYWTKLKTGGNGYSPKRMDRKEAKAQKLDCKKAKAPKSWGPNLKWTAKCPKQLTKISRKKNINGLN